MALWRCLVLPKWSVAQQKELPLIAASRMSSAHFMWGRLMRKCSEQISTLGEILTRQCHFYAFQRARRATQIYSLYTRLYNEKAFRCLVSGFFKRLVQKQQKSKLGLMLGAILFSWEKDRVADAEIKNSVRDFDDLSHQKDSVFLNGEKSATVSDWEMIVFNQNLSVWRKQVANSCLYEYRVFGTFFDIPARAFFSVQTDTEYRKKWDKLVIQLDMIDKEEGGSEVLYWVMHYPYPMYSRDYVYVRRAVVDAEANVMVLVSRAVDHPGCPEDSRYVRVKRYSSRMVIRPHSTFDENGFDYLLTYFDDPNAAFPAPAYNWMASTGVPDFVNKLHNAALDLHMQSRMHQAAFCESNVTSGLQSLPVYA